MIDNFKLIKPLLTFESDDDFYHLQILRRGKDWPNLPAANRVIRTYYIDCYSTIHEDEIKGLCEYFGARAYINLAPKSYRKCTMQCIADMAVRAKDGDFKKIYKTWNTVTGAIKSKYPHWIVDVDDVNGGNAYVISDIANYINSIQPVNVTNKVITYIPTKSGIHIITTPFNIMEFKNKYPDIDVHKNNPTILYTPKSLDQ